jgi:hypothetical protein
VTRISEDDILNPKIKVHLILKIKPICGNLGEVVLSCTSESFAVTPSGLMDSQGILLNWRLWISGSFLLSTRLRFADIF